MLVGAYFAWGGRGGGVCVNICVPSSPQVKPILAFNSNKGT
jgi:hypothetical protein